MKKFIKLLLVILVLLLCWGCKRSLKASDYERALASIELDFDVNNVSEDVKLPVKTKKLKLDLLWRITKIESDEDGYQADCASIAVEDGVSYLVTKIEYDGDYDNRIFGKVTLTALLVDDDNNAYTRDFVVTVYEEIPNINYTITQIKTFCTLEKPIYVSSKLTILLIKKCDAKRYNIVASSDNEYIFINSAYYDKKYNLKAGDDIRVSGVSGSFNGYPIITSSDLHDCNIELVNKGSFSYDVAQEIAYQDFAKIKASDNSIYLNLVKFDGIIKANDTSDEYAYHIEGTKNKELVVNISNYSFEKNNISFDNNAKKQIDKMLNKEVSIVGFIFMNTDGVWEVIVVPSELK